MSGLDVLFLTANRRRFTELTFEMLIRNTNWDLVSKLIVYDDHSIDGAREEVSSRLDRVPVPHEIRDHDLGSPVAVMNNYISQTSSRLFAKIDNDLVVPPHWLEDMLGVMDKYPGLQLLGTEAPFMGPPTEDWDGTYDFTDWRHIGGIGLMRTKFFKDSGEMGVDGYHGFTGHQWKWNPKRGWITPDLLTVLLDRCPVEPWVSLSDEYVKHGWQRRWPKISDRWSVYWSWIPKELFA